MIAALVTSCAATPSPSASIEPPVAVTAGPASITWPMTGWTYRTTLAFGVEGHRGDDWTAVDIGTALGGPVRSMASGVVVFAGDGDRDGFKGWGNVVIVRHRMARVALPDAEIESFYGHLESVTVRPDQTIREGQVVGTIGTGGGRYAPHVHFEIRDRLGMGIQAGSGALDGWLDPTEWLRDHHAKAG